MNTFSNLLQALLHIHSQAPFDQYNIPEPAPQHPNFQFQQIPHQPGQENFGFINGRNPIAMPQVQLPNNLPPMSQEWSVYGTPDGSSRWYENDKTGQRIPIPSNQGIDQPRMPIRAQHTQFPVQYQNNQPRNPIINFL